VILLPNWRAILKRAWSIRLMLLAGLLTGMEFILPMVSHSLPDGVFAGLSFLAVSSALIARLVAQKT